MSRLLLLGGGILQTPAVRLAQEMGHEVFCFDARQNPPAAAAGAKCFPVDFGDSQKAIKQANILHQRYSFQGVMTLGTDHSYTVSMIAAGLGLPSHSPEAAFAATDKYTMRQRLLRAGLDVPGFALIEGCMELPRDLNYPLVVKPSDSMGARGVVKVSNHKEFMEAFHEARKFSRSRRVVVEEFLDGPEFSLDGLVQGDQLELFGIADRRIALEPHFVELGHKFPSSRPLDEQKAVKAAFWRGVKALGLDCGGVKGDVKFNKGRAYIGEIAGRLSGGFMSGWSYPFHSGRSAVRGAIQIALGRPWISDPPMKHRPVFEGALIAPPGTILQAEWNISLPAQDSFFWLALGPGDRSEFPVNNVQKVGNAIIAPSMKPRKSLQREGQSNRLKEGNDREENLDQFSPEAQWDEKDFWKELGKQRIVLAARDERTMDYFRQEPRLRWITLGGRIPGRAELPPLPSEGHGKKPQEEETAAVPWALDLFGNPLEEQWFLLLKDLSIDHGGQSPERLQELWLAYCLGGPSLLEWRHRL
jgi:biotin carboxylase